jgi:hypothetical protein
MPRQWMLDPNSGGIKIPPAIQADVEKRIQSVAQKEFSGKYIERLRNTPAHLCRLRYFGNDEWGFAFYTYSHEKYELSIYDDGQFTGKPERAFQISANVYLNE